MSTKPPHGDPKALAAKWFEPTRANSRAPMRLYCFPYAGGGSAIYRDWGEALAGVARVVAVKPPGRESRFGEAALDDVHVIARHFVEAFASQPTDLPFSFFGHSLGALVAFEVTRLLTRRGGALPRVLIVSGSSAPTARNERAVADLPHAQFVAELEKLAGTPREVLDNPELMGLLLPMLRADFRAAEKYVRAEGGPIARPMFIYGGESDEDVSEHALDAWRVETVAASFVRRFEGGHFFVNTARPRVLDQLRADLAASISM